MKIRIFTLAFATLFALSSSMAADKPKAAAKGTEQKGAAPGKAVPITVVAFGGTVKITGPDNKAIKAAKGLKLAVGTTISTGPNSWMDIAQGGLSAIRIKAKTASFKIDKSSLSADGKVNSNFKLKSGAAFVRVNKKALPQGSKYQVQMPELIAGVVGSEGEMVDGPGGCTVVCISGGFVGNGVPIPPGSMMVDPVGGGGPSVNAAPDNVLAACNAAGDTLPTPAGDATDGTATGGTTDAGVTPGADAIGAAATAGDPTGGDAGSDAGTDVAPADTGNAATDQTSPETQISDEEASPSSP